MRFDFLFSTVSENWCEKFNFVRIPCKQFVCRPGYQILLEMVHYRLKGTV